MTKVCSKCHIEKNLSEFNKETANKDKLARWCRKCLNEYNRQYRVQNKTELSLYNKKYLKQYYIENREKISRQTKEYGLRNREKISEKYKKYRSKNKEKISRKDKEYRSKNKEKIKKNSTIYMRERRRKDGDFRLLAILRLRIWHAIKDGCKSDRTFKLIGCSLEELKSHLQQTAINNGYITFNINNYSGNDYHIDHIVPCDFFNLKCSFHQKLCFNYKNMQILTREENLKKAARDLNYSIS